MSTATDYDAQATAFLDKHGLKFTATEYPAAMQDAPEWSDSKPLRTKVGMLAHGLRYRVKITRQSDHAGLSFDFWGSIADRASIELAKTDFSAKAHQAARAARLTAYSVLACLSSDVNCPETFDGFCDEYGYDSDSRKAEALFNRCRAFGIELRAFFTPEQREELAEIQ
jgi:hypothetical protein